MLLSEVTMQLSIGCNSTEAVGPIFEGEQPIVWPSMRVCPYNDVGMLATAPVVGQQTTYSNWDRVVGRLAFSFVLQDPPPPNSTRCTSNTVFTSYPSYASRDL